MDGDDKRWWASKGVWGGMIALAAGIAGLMGVEVGADVQTALADKIPAVISAIGGVLAVIGRIVADSRING